MYRTCIQNPLKPESLNCNWYLLYLLMNLLVHLISFFTFYGFYSMLTSIIKNVELTKQKKNSFCRF